MDLKREPINLNYTADKSLLSNFIHFYQEDTSDAIKYLTQISKKKIILDLNDIAVSDYALYTRVIGNFKTYINMIYDIIDGVNRPSDVVNVHRSERMKEKEMKVSFPKHLLRDYILEVRVRAGYPETSKENNKEAEQEFSSKAFDQSNFLGSCIVGIRKIRSDLIGKFITTRGIITKISTTKPSIKVAVYVCDSCGSETYQEINNEEFRLLSTCNSEKCRITKLKGTLSLITRVSKFEPLTTLILQEIREDTPEGCIPRSIRVDVREGKLRAGDFAYVGGVVMVRQVMGLINDIYVEGYGISTDLREKKREKAPTEKNMRETEIEIDTSEKDTDGNSIDDEILRLSDVSPFYFNHSPDRLVDSFAPHIYGLRDVKKILLLMLIGSPLIEKEDGIRIRGDINVLLLGDPGIAKSELLKYSKSLCSKSVYTVGRGSSGVGLTVSLLRDPFTKEFVLEAGALLLSDKGLCCLDEMDKMEENNRLSLHEVLEQQTISVSKAGINVTLNARCCVLGAANFKKGFYDDSKDLTANTGLPVSLLSRFDVVVVMRDERDKEIDNRLADYVIKQHTGENGIGEEISKKSADAVDGTEADADDENIVGDKATANCFSEDSNALLSQEQLRDFIQHAKSKNPKIPENLNPLIINAYTTARQKFANLTPRFLLSLIRLSISHARLRMDNNVSSLDIEEAVRLLEVSQTFKKKKNQLSAKYAIYNEIMRMASIDKKIEMEKIIEAISYNSATIVSVVREFEENGIWVVENGVLHILN